MSKQSPICPVCSGWLEEVRLDSGLWMKCRSCSYMVKASKKIIKPIGD